MMAKVWLWLGRAFSDEHGPSSSRIISAWLSVSSMTLIWWVARHCMFAPVDKLSIWLSNLPLIIGALATFSTAPYGVMKLTSMFKKGADKVVEHAVGTNNPNISGNFSNLQVVHCVRVDLTDPDVRLFTTPKTTNYVAESRETLNLSVPHFLTTNKLQVVADAGFYNASPGGSDPSSEGLPCEVYGLQICTGAVVSAESSADYAGDPRAASLLFTTNKQPMFVFRNLPPGTNTDGIYTAVTGFYPIVSNGVNVGAVAINSYPDPIIHQVQPRTAYGVSKDNRYLLVLTIDGRQGLSQGVNPPYSDGALDVETGYWMTNCGAWNAINMDGGGSTALYMSDSTGNPVAVNHLRYLPAYGRERYIGSHFGVFAKPMPGFRYSAP